MSTFFFTEQACYWDAQMKGDVIGGYTARMVQY
jgi:hypothetical protein